MRRYLFRIDWLLAGAVMAMTAACGGGGSGGSPVMSTSTSTTNSSDQTASVSQPGAPTGTPTDVATSPSSGP